MALNTRQLSTEGAEIPSGSKWTQRRDIPLTILAWIALVAVVVWAAAHIARSLLLVAIAALLAYALAPAVKLLERVMPRFLAMIIVYLLVLSGLSVLGYFIIGSAVMQAIQLKDSLGANGQLSHLLETLKTYGITQEQINQARSMLFSSLGGVASGVLPVLKGVFEGILDLVVVAMLSIYLLVDGSRLTSWLRTNAPLLQRERVRSSLDTLERVVGGYIRGQLALAVLIGLLVGVGMAVLGVPHPILLGVLAFVLAFIPILGTFFSAAACFLLALTQGVLIAVIVLVYFGVVHAIEAYIVGPRLVGHAIGLHPAISLFALVTGAELFGIWGVLFAAPVAGLAQAMVVALWKEWRIAHPDQFPLKPRTEQLPVEAQVDHIASESDATTKMNKIVLQQPTDSVT